MVNFVCTSPCLRIVLTVAMETMHFFIVQLSLSLRTKILCVSGVPMNDLAPMKNCPGGGGCKVGQISSRSKKLAYIYSKSSAAIQGKQLFSSVHSPASSRKGI